MESFLSYAYVTHKDDIRAQGIHSHNIPKNNLQVELRYLLNRCLLGSSSVLWYKCTFAFALRLPQGRPTVYEVMFLHRKKRYTCKQHALAVQKPDILNDKWLSARICR